MAYNSKYTGAEVEAKLDQIATIAEQLEGIDQALKTINGTTT